MEDEIELENLLTVEEIEWAKLKNARFKNGYVDGKHLGGESTLQNGFDHGYANGFEISYSISVVKGFLAVNEIMLKEMQKHSLLSRSTQINKSLDEFEKRCNELKMNCLISRSEDTNDDDLDVTADIRNENMDIPSSTLRSVDENSSLDFVKSTNDLNVDNNHLNEVTQDLKELEEEVLHFLNDCNQPMILDQITHIFQNWSLQPLSRHSSGQAECTDHPEPPGTDSLLTSA